MTNIVAFTRLHYGADYLPYVLRSALPFVDKHLVIYTSVPTFGRYTDLPNPDSRDALLNAAQSVGSDKVLWLEGVPVEVDTALRYFPDADIVLELDADEIIEPALFEDIIARYERGELTDYVYRLPFLHFWRSFDYACDDPGWPMRLYLPKNVPGEATMYPTGNIGRVLHFGYCRTQRDMAYKWETSVHIGELRPEWWRDIWAAFPQRLIDVHPVMRDWWNAEPYDKARLPDFMREHPYFSLEIVE